MAATDFDVITFGNSLLLNDVFNAVASVFGNDSYSVAMGTCMTAASIGIMISAVLQGRMVNLLWFLQVIFLYMMLIVPKVSVNIIDKTDIDPAHVVGGWTVRRVDNVPIGLAMTASSVSTFSSWLTTSFETVFSLPNEMRFQTNGPLFGQSLIKKAMTYKVQNPDLQESLKSFWQSCVFYDVALGFYTFGDLAKQTDILAFIGSHTVQTRGFYLGGSGAPTFQTCADGVTPLRTQIDNDLLEAQQSIGNSVRTTMPSSSQVAAAGWTAMPVAFQYLTSVSITAKNLLMQSVMANSMDDGLNALAGNADANAAIQGYALARAERERETTFGTMGKMAGDMMPLLRNIMEGLIYAVFPLVGLAIMFPNGWKAMGYYAKMLVWIGLWPVAFALLHYMMTFFGSLAGAKAATAIAGSAAAYTIETQLGLQAVFNKYEAITGYIMTMLPMVTYVMVSQGGAAMSGMLGRVLDGYSKPASSAGMEATAGNYSMGNVSYENQAAFQHSSAPTQSAGFATTNDGRYKNTYSQHGITTQQEQSNLIASPSTSKSLERATAQSVETAESHVSSTTTNLAKGRDEAIRESFTTAKSGSSVTSAGTSTQQQNQTATTKMTEAVVASAKEFAKGQNWSAEQKQSFVNEVSDSFSGGFSGGLSGGVGPANLGVKVGKSHTTASKDSQGTSSGTGETAQNMEKFLASEQGKTALQNVQSIAQSTASGRTNTSSKSEDSQHAHAVGKTQKLEEAYSEALQELRTAKEMQTNTEKSGFTMEQKQTDAMLSDLRKSGVAYEKGLADIQAGQFNTTEAIQTQNVMDQFVQRNIQERLDVAKESARIRDEGQDAQADLQKEARIPKSVKDTGTLAKAAEKQAINTESSAQDQAETGNNKLVRRFDGVLTNESNGAANVQNAVQNNGVYPVPQDPDDIPKPPEVVGDIPPNPNNPNRR